MHGVPVVSSRWKIDAVGCYRCRFLFMIMMGVVSVRVLLFSSVDFGG